MARATRKTQPTGSVVHEVTQDAKEIAQELAKSAQETALGGAQYAQDLLHDGLRRADALVAEYTGRSVNRWRADLKAHVRQHPLSSFGMMVAVGFVIGKLIQSRGATGLDEAPRHEGWRSQGAEEAET
jgi:ElaB/YqjD/DUF883 family membrane-anchored ribosome-binding protein